MVLGAPAYYRRFGFVPRPGFGLTSPWSGLGDPWQALLLTPAGRDGPAAAAGEVLFPAPWGQV